jgi:hypothetical protein
MSNPSLMEKVYDSFLSRLKRANYRPVPNVLKVEWNMWPPKDVESGIGRMPS